MRQHFLLSFVIILLGVTATVSAQVRPRDLSQGPPIRVPVPNPTLPTRPPTATPQPAPPVAPTQPPPATSAPLSGGTLPTSTTTPTNGVFYENALAAPNGVRQFLMNTQRSVGFPFGTFVPYLNPATNRPDYKYSATNYVLSFEQMAEFGAAFNLPINDDRVLSGTNFGSLDVQDGHLLMTGFGFWVKAKDQKARNVYVKYYVSPFELTLMANSNLTRYDVGYQNWQTAVNQPPLNLNGALSQLNVAGQSQLVTRFNQLQAARPQYRVLGTATSSVMNARIVWTSMRVEHFPEELKNTPAGYVDLMDVKAWLKNQGFPEDLNVQMDNLWFANATPGIDTHNRSFSILMKPTVLNAPAGIEPVFLGPYVY